MKLNLPEELHNYNRKHKLTLIHTGDKLKKNDFSIGRQYFTLKVSFGKLHYIEIIDKGLKKEWFAIPLKDGSGLNWLSE